MCVVLESFNVMADVSFDEEPKFAARTNGPVSYGSSRKTVLMKLGVARSEQESQYVLIGLAVLCVALSVFIFIKQNVKPSPKVPPLPTGIVPKT
ncbi:MAG: hypothetical protein JWN90_497 [Parcubacteria group bacterium]|nr:hypothetical protein [Parcubacteria group bacterium]